jgi:hypothetical protein
MKGVLSAFRRKDAANESIQQPARIELNANTEEKIPVLKQHVPPLKSILSEETKRSNFAKFLANRETVSAVLDRTIEWNIERSDHVETNTNYSENVKSFEINSNVAENVMAVESNANFAESVVAIETDENEEEKVVAVESNANVAEIIVTIDSKANVAEIAVVDVICHSPLPIDVRIENTTEFPETSNKQQISIEAIEVGSVEVEIGDRDEFQSEDMILADALSFSHTPLSSSSEQVDETLKKGKSPLEDTTFTGVISKFLLPVILYSAVAMSALAATLG